MKFTHRSLRSPHPVARRLAAGLFPLLLATWGCTGGASGDGAGGATEPPAGVGGVTGAGGVVGPGNGSGGRGVGGASGVGGATGAAVGGRTGTDGGVDRGVVGTGGAGVTSCTTPPPPSALAGWAAVDGMGQNGTTGGGDAAPVTVTTAAALTSNAAGTAARVIYVMGSLTGSFSIGSNKTVVGLCGASLHGHVGVSNAVNVIVRNLTIVGNNCADSPADCSGGADAVTIGTNSHHVWFDHDDVYDGSDGNLDITSGADFVTISWTKFHYSTMRTDVLLGASGHRFSNLIGSADTVLTDAGHLNVTFHHDWWADNVNQRMPRTRFGKIHVFNNLFTSTGNSYCTNSGFMATVLVENNIYSNVRGPLQPDVGNMLARGNLFQNTVGGSTTTTGTGFVPPYVYALDATTDLAAAVMAGVGPH